MAAEALKASGALAECLHGTALLSGFRLSEEAAEAPFFCQAHDTQPYKPGILQYNMLCSVRLAHVMFYYILLYAESRPGISPEGEHTGDGRLPAGRKLDDLSSRLCISCRPIDAVQ